MLVPPPQIRYRPRQLSSEDKGTVTISAPDFLLQYEVSGSGTPPPPEPVTSIMAGLGQSAGSYIMWHNPFPEVATVSLRVRGVAQREAIVLLL